MPEAPAKAATPSRKSDAGGGGDATATTEAARPSARATISMRRRRHAVDPERRPAGETSSQRCTLRGDQQAEHVGPAPSTEVAVERQGGERQLVGGVGPGGGAEQGGEGFHAAVL